MNVCKGLGHTVYSKMSSILRCFAFLLIWLNTFVPAPRGFAGLVKTPKITRLRGSIAIIANFIGMTVVTSAAVDVLVMMAMLDVISDFTQWLCLQV